MLDLGANKGMKTDMIYCTSMHIYDYVNWAMLSGIILYLNG